MDENAGEDSLFKGLAASGWHTAAITMRLNVDGGLPIAGGIIGGGGELTWPAPTRAGDILHVENEVLEITPSRSRPDRGRVTVLVRTSNQRGEIVQTLKAYLIVPAQGSALISATPPVKASDNNKGRPLRPCGRADPIPARSARWFRRPPGRPRAGGGNRRRG